MKHVWIFNHYAQEPGQIGLTRHYYLARNLPPAGWKASIIAASIEHNSGRQRLAPGETTRLELHGGVPFLWLRAPSYSGNGVDRVRNILAYTARTLSRTNLSQLEPPHAILGSSVHPLAALAGWNLSRRFNVPFVFEVRDLWPQTLIEMGALSAKGLPARMLRTLELFLYRRAAFTISPLPFAKDYIVPLGIPADRIIHLPNGIDLSEFPAFPYAGQSSTTFQLMYFGAHGEANGLDTLLRAMHIVERRKPATPIRLRMIGGGPLKSELQQLARELVLASVVFEVPVPKYDIPRLASQADALVLCVRDLPNLYRYGISMNKLSDYLAAGRPIIIASGAANDPVKDAGAGFSVPPENPERLAEAILTMASLPIEQRKEMGAAGRRHAEECYGYDRLAARLAGTLESSCEQSR